MCTTPLQVVNTALRVYDEDSRAPLTPAIALNAFFGLPPMFNRSVPLESSLYGPALLEARVIYDSNTRRWFVVGTTVDRAPDYATQGYLTGPNWIDLAVSDTHDPTGEGSCVVLAAWQSHSAVRGTPRRCRTHQGLVHQVHAMQ